MGGHQHEAHLSVVLIASVLMVGTTAAGRASAEMATSCALALSIEAEEVDAASLRIELTSGLLSMVPASYCQDAAVIIRPGESSSYIVTITRGDVHMSRGITSIPHAAVWIESWLIPVDQLPSGAEVLPDEESPQQTSTSTPPAARTRLQLSMVVSLAGEASIWMGSELGFSSLLTDRFWIGGAMSLDFWIQDNTDGAEWNDDIPIFRFALRGGYRHDLTRRLGLDLGVGLGLSWTLSSSAPSILSQKCSPSWRSDSGPESLSRSVSSVGYTCSETLTEASRPEAPRDSQSA